MGLMRRLVLVVTAGLCVVAFGAVRGVAPALAAVSFGEAGSGAGQFVEPHGVAVDQESGDVWIVDRNNNRLEKWSGGGEFLFASGWGVADGHTEAAQTCTNLCFRGLPAVGYPGAGDGQLRSPEGVAVDNGLLSASRGDVYVFDIANYRVDKFDSTGAFVLAFGHGVNASTPGDVCLAGEACQAGTSGYGAGEFGAAEGDGVAVGPTGTVFVGDLERVQELSPGGVYEGQIALPGAEYITGVAVDQESGDVYVLGRGLSGVHEYDASGTELGAPRDASGTPLSIAVGTGGELFVNDGEGASHHILRFDSAGNELASFDAGPEDGRRGLAWGEGDGGLYVLGRSVVRFVSPLASGPVVYGGSAAEVQPTTVTLGALVNPENAETSYHFEYGTSTGYGASTPPASLSASFEDQPVSAAVTGLLPRTTYHYRVVASSAAGTAFGADGTFETLPPALIDSGSVSHVTSDGAVLAAQINPLGVDTRYRLEYGPTTAYGTSVPVPDGDAGSGRTDFVVSAPVGGLSAGAVYHYRVVAYNALGTVEGADRMFATQSPPVSGLLDGRAWEMVSPPEKHSVSLEALSPVNGGLIQAARDGSAISYLASAPIDREPSGNRSFVFTQVLSRRGADGWGSQGIATTNEAPAFTGTLSTGEYKLFSGDLSVGLVESDDESQLVPAAAKVTPYRREADGGFTPLVLAAGLPPGTLLTSSEGAEMFQGASPDLSHAVLSAHLPLLPGVPADRTSLYEWAGGSLRVASILPNGKQAAEEGVGAALGHEGFAVRHAVSDDGSRIIWTGGNDSGSEHLYLRDMRLEKTVQLDVVEEGAQGGREQPFFQTASSDGSKVFFTDDSRLTKDATSREGEPDLYMCEIGETAGRPTCELKDLTVDPNKGEAANVQGIALGAGEDGRYVYFVADGALAPGAAPARDLYVYDTVTGVRRLVAALSDEDQSDWSGGNGNASILSTVRVSPNGRYLAFMSLRSLTGYDNRDANSGQPDTEVFLYDANAGRVVCASCDPSGARPTGVFDALAFPGLLVDRYGASEWAQPREHWLAGSIPGWDKESGDGRHSWYQSHYLSDSGRLFFNAADALVPQDTNGKEDVYEYEPDNVGACSEASGCVGLISSGTSGEESALLDASESGNDVFFLTASRLVSQDIDGALDVYDARVCTAASPCLAGAAASVPAACASSDSCRGAGGAQPDAFTVPASTDAVGAGNLATPPAIKPVLKARRLTRAQKLAAALRTCRKKQGRKRRVSCEMRSRRLYGKGAGAKTARGAGATGKGNG
jgi:hypothetical protein